MVECNLWKKKTGETTKKPTQTQFRPAQNPHGVTETRIRDSRSGRRATDRLRHGFVRLIYS